GSAGDDDTERPAESASADADEASSAESASADADEASESTPAGPHDPNWDGGVDTGHTDDTGSADAEDDDPDDGTEGDPDDDTESEAEDTDEDDPDDDADEDDGIGDGGTATVDDGELAGIEGPETDEEMPLAAHIEEMMRRLAIVFLLGGLATLVVVTESTTLINYFWDYHIPAPRENRPRLYAPLELPLTRLKVAGIAGVVVGLPAFVYQTYRFMKPGLYENERRYYLAAVPTSLVLAGIGVAFAHFLVLPAIFSYFTTYTADAATIAFGLAETFNLIVIMLGFMAIVFQIPLFIMLAIMMNLVTRVWLEDKRLIFWGAFLGIAFLFSPDPTGMAPIIVTLTMIVLFEGTLAVLRWTGN
ncbi:twin-arginine translocase subunit TatC, partial [Halorubrum tibetense]